MGLSASAELLVRILLDSPRLLRSTATYALTMSHGNNYFKGKKHALFFHGDFLPFAAITRAFVGCKFRGAIGIAHEVSHVSLVSNANLRIIKYHPSISFFSDIPLSDKQTNTPE